MKPKIIPQELSLKKPFLLGLSTIGITLIILAIFWRGIPPQIPLFFSKPRGEAQLGTSYMLLVPLSFSLLLLIANSLFIQILSPYPLLKRIVILGGTTACILAAITVIRILFVVI